MRRKLPGRRGYCLTCQLICPGCEDKRTQYSITVLPKE
jgi:hypothetical protein